MNQWHTFLASQGAVISDNAVLGFGNKEAELSATANGAILADLSHLSLLQLSGEDAVSFLQGQVTNDVKQLNGSNSQFAGYCNPKGRLLALFLAYAHDSKLYLQLDGRLAEAIAKRLRMYVLRSKVVIEDISASTVRLGVAGTNAEQALAGLFAGIPQRPLAMSQSGNGLLIRLPGELPRFEIICAVSQAEKLWSELQKSLKPVGTSNWEWLEIQAGIPNVVPRTQEEFVPQMINLDALDGINYKKGCYTGQEIVARTHYLGKVKRRTQLAHVSGSNQPQPGEDVLLEGNDEAVGKIVRSAPSPAGGFDVLAELRLESMEAGRLICNGGPLALSHLPYRLD
ncbi:MAG TPA: folate-binding protein [Methylophilaceae bacterium]|nr:folate-binding protein [Methylophilaceae bacterium]